MEFRFPKLSSVKSSFTNQLYKAVSENFIVLKYQISEEFWLKVPSICPLPAAKDLSSECAYGVPEASVDDAAEILIEI